MSEKIESKNSSKLNTKTKSTTEEKVGVEKKVTKKPLSEEGKRITKKIEEMTGIKLMDDEEVTHKKDNCVDNSPCKKASDKDANCNEKTKKPTQKSDVGKGEDKGTLQNVKDVDFGEDEVNKPLIFKCPNDLRVTLKKDSGEYIIDEDCCTSVLFMLKNTGEIVTNFSGAHSPELTKILDKSLRKYLKELKRTLKKEYKMVNDELTLSQEPLDEEKKWNDTV